MLLSLVILCVVCIWHALVTVFIHRGDKFIADLERDVFIAFAVVYVLCHLVFMFWLYFDVSSIRKINVLILNASKIRSPREIFLFILGDLFYINMIID